MLTERGAADGHQHNLGVDGFFGAIGRDRYRPEIALARHRLVAMPQHHGDTALDERAAQLLGDFRVEAGEHLFFHFDDRHLGAERAVEIAELESDWAGADHDDARGHRVEHQRLLAGNHAVADFHSL